MRDQAIEAMAAAADPWEVFVANDGYNAIRVRNAAELAEAHLDALLDYLTEHADEWVEAAASAELDDAMQRGDHLLADVLLAVLR